MQPQDKAEFVRVLNGLATIKPGKDLTPEAISLWWSSMSDWSIEEFRSAASHLAQTSEFMPNPYHFAQIRKAGRETAGEAWAKAIHHAESSNYRYGEMGDALIDAAVRMLGGYSVIAMCERDKLGFLERRFCEHYEAKQDADDTRSALPALTMKSLPTHPKSVAALLARLHE